MKCKHPKSSRKCKWIGFCLIKEWCGKCKKVLEKNFTKKEEEQINGFEHITTG